MLKGMIRLYMKYYLVIYIYINMTYAEYQVYIQTIDEVEKRIDDDSKCPVVKDNKMKICCKTTLELTKILIYYLKYDINNASKETKSKTKTKDE